MSKFCPKCNSEMPEESNFCLSCMTPYSRGDLSNLNQHRKKQKDNRFFSTQNIRNFLTNAKHKFLNDKKRTAAYLATALCAVFLLTLGSISLANSNQAKTVKSDKNGITQGQETTDKKENEISSFIKEVLGIEETEDDNTENSSPKENNSQNTNEIGTANTSNTNSTSSDKGKNVTETSDKVTNSNKQPGSSITNNSNTSKPGITGNTQSGNSNSDNFGSSNTDNEPNIIPNPAYGDFKYTLSSNGNKYYITEYTGNDKIVTIPATYNGKPVSEIESHAFQNSNIEYVYFESIENQGSVYFRSSCFYNCPNLKKITFPETSLSITNGFASNCPSLESLGGIGSGNSYKYENGCLYYKKEKLTYMLRFICPNAQITTLTIPSWCSGVESALNLSENKNIKTINMHKNCTSFPDSYMKNDCLESVNVDSGNSVAFSKNGVLFTKSSGSYLNTFYPNKNKTKSFTIPDNVTFNVYSGSPVNPYLETLYIPKSAKINGQERIAQKRVFTNLKTIYVQSGSAYESYFKQNFNGTVKTY